VCVIKIFRDLTHIRQQRQGRRLLKNCVSILLWNFAFVWNYPECLSVLKLAPGEYATNGFNTNYKHEKSTFMVHVLQTTENLVITPFVRDVLRAVCVVFCVRSRSLLTRRRIGLHKQHLFQSDCCRRYLWISAQCHYPKQAGEYLGLLNLAHAHVMVTWAQIYFSKSCLLLQQASRFSFIYWISYNTVNERIVALE